MGHGAHVTEIAGQVNVSAHAAGTRVLVPATHCLAHSRPSTTRRATASPRSESGTSMYVADPDGARVELIADPLVEMYDTIAR